MSCSLVGTLMWTYDVHDFLYETIIHSYIHATTLQPRRGRRRERSADTDVRSVRPRLRTAGGLFTMSVIFDDEGRPIGTVDSVARKLAPGEGKAAVGAVRLEREYRWWLSLGDCRRRDQ